MAYLRLFKGSNGILSIRKTLIINKNTILMTYLFIYFFIPPPAPTYDNLVKHAIKNIIINDL